MRHKKRGGRTAQRWNIGGVELTSSQIAQRAGISVAAFYKRLALGWSIERIAAEPTHRHPVTCNGETRSIAEWSRVSGIPKKNIRERLVRGWPPERAIYAPVTDMAHTIAFMGQVRPLFEWSRLTGIDANVIRQRLRLNWPIKRALTEPIGPRGRKRKASAPDANKSKLTDRGAVGDFSDLEGTGGGRFARDLHELGDFKR